MGDDNETKEQMESRHKKEIKALEGEKRAAIKKAKSLKGKKGKEALANVEEEFTKKNKEMQERHQKELTEISSGGGGDDNDKDDTAAANNDAPTETPTPDSGLSKEEEERQRKMEKARRKREKQKEKERRREQEIAEETAAAGPTPRDVENSQLRATLQPLNLTIRDVAADGNCLYRAVAAQLSRQSNEPQFASPSSGYVEVRAMCANALEQNSEEFAPFVEYTESAPDFSSYVQRVRSSADWGGHLELRAISMATQRPIHVYSTANGAKAMVIEGGGDGEAAPILLSYHLHYYALGEHYNEVVPLDEDNQS